MKHHTFPLKRSLLLPMIVGLCFVNSSCTLKTPKFTTSIAQTPAHWVNLDEGQNYQVSDVDITRLEWWKAFEDADLVNLIDEGLKSNHDIARAANRIRQAQAKLNSVRVDKNPTLDTLINTSKTTSSEEIGRPAVCNGALCQTGATTDPRNPIPRNARYQSNSIAKSRVNLLR